MSEDIAKAIRDLAVRQMATDVITKMPEEHFRSLIADAFISNIEGICREYGTKKVAEEAVISKMHELLATPEFQVRIENQARKIIEELLPSFSVAMARTMLDAFGNDRKNYNNSVFSEKFAKELKLKYGTEFRE